VIVAAIVRARLPFHPQTFPGMRLWRTPRGQLVLAYAPRAGWIPHLPLCRRPV
jgi:hypothetical protein